MGQELELQNEEKKRKHAAWGKFGVKLIENEVVLSGKMTKVESFMLTDPKKETVIQDEANLKEAKAQAAELKEMRLQVTSPLEKVKSRLMEHEKRAADLIKDYTNKIIVVKRVIESERAAAGAKEEEKKDLVSKIKLSYIEYDSEFKRYINELVLDEYIKMLEADVKFEDYDALVSEIKVEGMKHSPFFLKQNFKRKYLSEDEYKAIYRENMIKAPDHIAEFASGIMEKKAGYRSELANKAKAMELLADKAKKDENERKAKEETAKLGLKIQAAAAVDATPKNEVKELKLGFEVDMEDNYDSALKLFACFSANLKMVLPELRVKKFLDLKPNQIAKVLSKLKSKDNSLEFSGIVFKATDKL